MTIYAVKDRWHKYINGDKTPEVRSDDPVWEGHIEWFFDWVHQHGGTSEIYEIES